MKKLIVKLFLLAFFALKIHASEELHSFQIANDSKVQIVAEVEFSNWGAPEDMEIEQNGLRFSTNILTKKLPSKLNPGDSREIIATRGLKGAEMFPITKNRFPFRLIIDAYELNKSATRSWIFTLPTQLPLADTSGCRAKQMSVDEANSPATILHFKTGKQPLETSDWDIVIESKAQAEKKKETAKE